MGTTRTVERVGVTTVALSLLVCLVHLSGIGGFAAQLTLYRAVLPVQAAAVVAVYWFAGSAGNTTPRARRTLRLLAAAWAVILATNLVRWWVSRTTQVGAYPLDLPAGTAADLAAVGFGLAAALMIPTRQGDRPYRVRLAVDMATVLIAALTVVWYVTAPAGLSTIGPAGLLLTIFPTAVMLVAAGAVARVLLAGVVGMRPLTLLLPVLGCAAEVSAGLLVPSLTDTPQLHLTLIASPLMAACFAAGAVTHVRWVTHPDRLRPRAARPAAKQYSLLPYLAILAVFALLVVAWARAEQDRGWPVVIGGALVTALVAARQILAFRDNDRLTRTLRHAARSDDVLLTAANALLSAPDEGAVLTHAGEAADALLDGTTGRAVVLNDAPRPDASPGQPGPDDDPHTMDLPLAGAESGGLTGVLRVSWKEPLPQETRRALSALQHQVDLALTTAALRRQLTHRASHDPLTGLANRSHLHHLLDRLAADPAGRAVVVLLIDLDGFKAVNDTAGHNAGDAVLREVAARLRTAVRPWDVVCRLGGDEFTVVLTDVERGEVDEIRERIGVAIAEPFSFGGRVYRIGASIGAAPAVTGTLDPDRLLHDADLEMYRIKAERKARVPAA